MSSIARKQTTIARDEIRTARLTLRAPAVGDVEAITRLCGDYAIASMTSRMPHPYAESDARQFVQLVARQDRARERTFVIEHEGQGAIGCIGFHKAAGAPLEMGYWISLGPYVSRLRHRGATRAAMHWASGQSATVRQKVVVAGHFADNPASANVLIKTGFLYTGEVQPRHSRARGQIAPTRMMVVAHAIMTGQNKALHFPAKRRWSGDAKERSGEERRVVERASRGVRAACPRLHHQLWRPMVPPPPLAASTGGG